MCLRRGAEVDSAVCSVHVKAQSRRAPGPEIAVKEKHQSDSESESAAYRQKSKCAMSNDCEILTIEPRCNYGGSQPAPG